MTQTIEITTSVAPAVRALINAIERDYNYVLCIESPVQSAKHPNAKGKNRITATNQQGVDLARMLGRFERIERGSLK
jgi:hypothetical protein